MRRDFILVQIVEGVMMHFIFAPAVFPQSNFGAVLGAGNNGELLGFVAYPDKNRMSSNRLVARMALVRHCA